MNYKIFCRTTKLTFSKSSISYFGSHCEKIGFNQDIPLWDWFARGFAGVLHYSALEKIWDKVIGGSIKILAYVALTKVELAQNVIFGCHTANEAIRCLTKVKQFIWVYTSIIYMVSCQGKLLLNVLPLPL